MQNGQIKGKSKGPDMTSGPASEEFLAGDQPTSCEPSKITAKGNKSDIRCVPYLVCDAQRYETITCRGVDDTFSERLAGSWLNRNKCNFWEVPNPPALVGD